MSGPFATAASAVQPVDQAAARSAGEHHDRLAKPRGSLGRLEEVGVRLAAIAGADPPPVPAPAAVAVFAGDHGVLAEGVSPWPREVTAQMAATVAAGGAGVSVLAGAAGASVVVVDVGVATPLEALAGLTSVRVREGTANLAVEPAMTRAEAEAALDVGAEVAARLAAEGARCLATGDLGIGNTTPSAALIAAFTGRPAAAVTGRGTGIDDRSFGRKVAAVERGLARTGSDCDALGVLASVGGLEHAALGGFLVGGAAARIPVVLDGVVSCAAALVAHALVPDALGYWLAGHRSTEPGASAALSHLGLDPLLDLGMRLGEGTGACLAVPMIQAAARILGEMATFASAGVAAKQPG